MKTTNFECKRGAFTVRGTEYKPDGDALEAVIISHGFGGHGRDMSHCGRLLAKRGYAVYCFDFCGGSIDSISDGDTTDMTIRTEVEDLKAVIAYVKDRKYVKDVILMGESQGGFVSALTAAQSENGVSKLILLCPALCIPDHARTGKLGGAAYDADDVPDIINSPVMRLSRKFHDEVVHMNPFDEIKKYTGDVLIMHGTDDKTVGFGYAEKAQNAYGADKCRLYPVNGAGHALSAGYAEYIAAVILQFLRGGNEIITVKVKTRPEKIEHTETGYRKIIDFTAECDNRYFKGVTLPGAVDVHTFVNGERTDARAEYTLEGTDCANQKCRIHIVNRLDDGEWKPVIDTDSRALAFLNASDLTAAAEYFANGVIVHIFVDRDAVVPFANC